MCEMKVHIGCLGQASDKQLNRWVWYQERDTEQHVHVVEQTLWVQKEADFGEHQCESKLKGAQGNCH